MYAFSRPTYAEIDLEAFRQNLALVRKLVGNQRRIMTVIKSNAYGHGIVACGKTALANGADVIGVATGDEGLCMRETAGMERIPMVILGPTLEREAERLRKVGLSVSIGANPLLRAHLAMARRMDKPARLHIQIDTGIGRDGYRHDDLSFLDELTNAKPGDFEGLWTHFAVADGVSVEDKEFTNLQCDRFDEVTAAVRKAGHKPTIHAANSGAILRHPRAYYDMVRPGLMLYGLEPSGDETLGRDLAPVMTLRSQLGAVKTVQPGDTISYGRLFTVPSERRIGVVPMGYGDGFPVAFSNRSHVIVRGKRVPIRGRVCMDQFMVDLSEVPEAEVGDEVVLYGRMGGERIPVEEGARIASTIPYELVCAVNIRVPRVYTNP